jgi:hypothetical protein
MSFTKYASLEQAQVLDLKGTPTRSRTASLDKLSEFRDYRTEDGYLYARIRAISSRVNKNHDGWPSVELAGGKDVFERHAKTSGFTLTAAESGNNGYGFSTFLGKPVFVDHNNSNPARARGVIVDSKLHVEDHHTSAHDPYYSSDDVDPEHTPPTWVELLLEVDAKQFPKLASAIIEGSKNPKKGIDGFSMGCDVEKSVCSICKNAAMSPDEYCKHVKLKGAEFDYINKNGHKTSRRSYENCYGIKFFEISAVFDPADETALLREVRSSVEKEAMDPTDEYFNGPDILHAGDSSNGKPWFVTECAHCKGEGCQLCDYGENGAFAPQKGHDGPEPRGVQYMAPVIDPSTQFGGRGMGPVRQGNTHIAENPMPQSDMMTLPEEVDTMRQDEVCPVCGSDAEKGEQCQVCGFVPPPDGMDNPDLDKAGEVKELGQDQFPAQQMTEDPPDAQIGLDNGPTPPNISSPVASVTSEMAWQIYHPKLAGKINTVERPLKPGSAPATNEPRETVLSDQEGPVTQRTAASMIAAVNQGENMSTQRTAADAPTADTKADKRVDVEGVGGVMQGNNEEASKPRGPHSWESDGTTTDVTGKGGILQDSNEEASRPSQGTESLPTADRNGDDSGFNKDKTTDDSGKTKTFDNSNEPNSAVTTQAFPTSSWKIAWGDERAFPADDEGLSGGSAKQGTDPVDPVGKAGDRVNVLERVPVSNPQTGTDQWTGTGGNGVTRQADPVTPKSIEGDDIVNLSPSKRSYVEMIRIADAEVELGITQPEQKYDRLAELEQASDEEIKTTAHVIARVREAGLRRQAATKTDGVGRVPSMRSAARTANTEPDESIFW